MPGPIQKPVGAGPIQTAKDVHTPPTPSVTRAVAFERAADNAGYWDTSVNPTRGSVPTRDPIYIELGNVEVGTRLQLLNLSKNPEAAFNSDAIDLKLTGRDVRNRQAAVYLTDEQMKELDLQPGDMISLRAVDEAGNASGSVTVEIQGNEWRTGNVREGNVDTPGAQMQLLDGEATRKNITAKIVNDQRPPQLLEKNTRFVTWTPERKELAANLHKEWPTLVTALGRDGASLEDLKAQLGNTALSDTLRANLKQLVDDPKLFRDMEAAGGGGREDNIIASNDFSAIASQDVALMMPSALEPGAIISVQNQRTGSSFDVTVDNNRTVLANLKDAKDGDPIILYPRDNNGVQGKAVELVYASRLPDGKAPNLKGGLAVRMPGVL